MTQPLITHINANSIYQNDSYTYNWLHISAFSPTLSFSLPLSHFVVTLRTHTSIKALLQMALLQYFRFFQSFFALTMKCWFRNICTLVTHFKPIRFDYSNFIHWPYFVSCNLLQTHQHTGICLILWFCSQLCSCFSQFIIMIDNGL